MTLDAEPGVTLGATTPMDQFVALGGNGAAINGIAFKALGSTSGRLVRINPGVDGARVTNCEFSGVPIAKVGVQSSGTHTDLTVSGNSFSGVATAIRVSGCHSGLVVEKNKISGWTTRGIYILGVGPATQRVVVSGNRVTDLAPGGNSRYPIVLLGHGEQPMSDVQVSDNVVIGANRAWTQHPGGTADQIALLHCDSAQVIRNESHFGGDMGITVAHGSDVSVSGNICTNNDTAGIWIGTDLGDSARGVTVTDNVCRDNGRNRNGDRHQTAEIKLSRAVDTVVQGNDLTVGTPDSQGAMVTPLTALHCDGVQISGNQLGSRADDLVVVGGQSVQVTP